MMMMVTRLAPAKLGPMSRATEQERNHQQHDTIQPEPFIPRWDAHTPHACAPAKVDTTTQSQPVCHGCHSIAACSVPSQATTPPTCKEQCDANSATGHAQCMPNSGANDLAKIPHNPSIRVHTPWSRPHRPPRPHPPLAAAAVAIYSPLSSAGVAAATAMRPPRAPPAGYLVDELSAPPAHAYATARPPYYTSPLHKRIVACYSGPRPTRV